LKGKITKVGRDTIRDSGNWEIGRIADSLGEIPEDAEAAFRLTDRLPRLSRTGLGNGSQGESQEGRHAEKK
jgi:hypothetical protein